MVKNNTKKKNNKKTMTNPPHYYKSRQSEVPTEEIMKIRSAEITMSAVSKSQYPAEGIPEIALAGRSNVGKSSLINGLLNRRTFARTSSTPGKTRTINFYLINNEFYFVDLPGYGYANANIEIKEKWGKMIERYLHTSKKIKCIFLLMDIRHEPSKNDKQMYEWIVYNDYQPVIIATKSDKINRSQIGKKLKIIKEGLGMPKEGVLIPFSAQTKQGRDEIYEFIEMLILSKKSL